MGKKVTKNVHVLDPKTGQRAALRPGDEVPDWATKQVTNPRVLEGHEEGDEPRTATDALRGQRGSVGPINGDVPPPPAPELEDLTVDELKAYADAREIDLSGARTKDQLVEKIREADSE